MSVYVIAELGSCHENSLSVMKEMAVMAHDAGADAIKLQWTSSPEAMGKRRGQAYADGYHQHYAQYLTWPKSWHIKLAKHCFAVGIDYLCTVYLPEDIAVVEPYVQKFKVSSFEATDIEFLKAHAKYKRTTIVSTGMCSEEELQPILAQPYVSLMHCVSDYPAELSQLNLAVLSRSYMHGFSDHSDPNILWTGGLAVAAGADVIEAHIGPDKFDPDNPDADHAMTPRLFQSYVTHIRMAREARGENHKCVQEGEKPWLKYRAGS
jgi:sialic acid synthase SpsE